jgi:hypothetical protein
VNAPEPLTVAGLLEHSSKLERKLAQARELLHEARQWKSKGYYVMRQRIDELLDGDKP